MTSFRREGFDTANHELCHARNGRGSAPAAKIGPRSFCFCAPVSNACNPLPHKQHPSLGCERWTAWLQSSNLLRPAPLIARQIVDGKAPSVRAGTRRVHLARVALRGCRITFYRPRSASIVLCPILLVSRACRARGHDEQLLISRATVPQKRTPRRFPPREPQHSLLHKWSVRHKSGGRPFRVGHRAPQHLYMFFLYPPHLGRR